MSQLSLFDPSDTVLADDERGRITYTPGFIDPETARSWFEELRTTVNWRGERRMIYEREVDVPRLMASFRLDSASENTPACILDGARRVSAHLDVFFNSVGLNRYRDGRDSVAPHGDKMHMLVAGHPIALLSLGATRRMTIRAKDGARLRVDIDLAPGSLLVMSHAAQSTHEHGIPKTKAAVGPRLSVVFRVRSSVDRPYDG